MDSRGSTTDSPAVVAMHRRLPPSVAHMPGGPWSWWLAEQQAPWGRRGQFGGSHALRLAESGIGPQPLSARHDIRQESYHEMGRRGGISACAPHECLASLFSFLSRSAPVIRFRASCIRGAYPPGVMWGPRSPLHVRCDVRIPALPWHVGAQHQNDFVGPAQIYDHLANHLQYCASRVLMHVCERYDMGRGIAGVQVCWTGACMGS